MRDFFGSYEYKLDNYMRIRLPLEYRKVYDEISSKDSIEMRLYATVFQQHISILTYTGFLKLVKEIENAFTKIDHQNAISKLYSVSAEVVVNKHGYIKIPKWIADCAALKPNMDATVVGAFDHVEIWNTENYDAMEEGLSAYIELLVSNIDILKGYKCPPLVFLSYSWKDKAIVDEIDNHLMNSGYRTFLDSKDIIPGEDLFNRVQISIDDADYFVFFSSNASTTSKWCSIEVSQALGLEVSKEHVFIIPMKIDDSPLPGLIRSKKYITIDCNCVRKAATELIKAISHCEKVKLESKNNLG